MSWARLDDQFHAHPKVFAAGNAAVGLWTRLLSWCAAHLTDGRIPKPVAMSYAESADQIRALCGAGLIDDEDDHYLIHDYLDWNPAGSKVKDQRKADAERKAAARRQNVRTESGSLSARIPCGQRAGVRTDSVRSPAVPSPSPSPSPSPDPKPVQNSKTLLRSQNERNGDILSVFDHYRKYHPRAHKKPGSKSKEWRLIKARLAEGASVDDLRTAIDGCHASPFHQGENDRGKKYDSLELIVRDGSHVNQFIEAWRDRGEPVLTERTRRNVRAGDTWAARKKAELEGVEKNHSRPVAGLPIPGEQTNDGDDIPW